MTDIDLLIQTLTAAQGGYASLFLDGGGYLDWSDEYDDGASMEVSDGVDAVVVQLSRADVVTLQQRLTLWLLNHPA